MTDPEPKKDALQGLRVLIVEDEALIALTVEMMLQDLGCEVAGMAFHLAEALPLAKDAEFDLALLDIHIRGEEVFPVAELLARRGIPFVFASGFGPESIKPQFRDRPLLRKPFQPTALRRILEEVAAPSPQA